MPQASTPEAQRYFSPAEAASILGVTRKAIYEATYTGRLPFVKFGRKTLIPAEALTFDALKGARK